MTAESRALFEEHLAKEGRTEEWVKEGEVRVWKVSDGSLVKGFNASPGYTPPKAAEPPKK